MKATVELGCECGQKLANLPDGVVACANVKCAYFGKEFVAPVFELRPKPEPKKPRK